MPRRIQLGLRLPHLQSRIRNLIGLAFGWQENPKLDMGLEPIKLNSEKLVEIHDYIKENKTDVRKETILPTSFW